MMVRHARTRGADRYGLRLTQDDLVRIVRQIQKGEAQYVGRDSNRVSIWIVEHSGRHLPAVYDKERQVIVTFLPLTAMCMEPYRSEWAGPTGEFDGAYREAP
jgi:hypothetical protein